MDEGDFKRVTARTAILHREMIAAGERLLQALAMEREFLRLDPDDETAEITALRNECRKIVGQFSEDYARATARWRLVVANAASASTPEPINRGSHAHREPVSLAILSGARMN
jgi:hypothetical protein